MARAKALPIARRLTARTDIKSADKPLLIEVCSLYHNGGRGVCDATNGHFAERLGEARETISRRLSRLASNGWLVINENKAAGFARTIVPTTQCLACYLAPEDLALLTEKSIAIDRKINSPLLTEYGVAIDQTGDPLLTIYGRAIDHLANSLLIVIEEAIKEQKERAIKEQAYEAASAALLEAERKIAELENENYWLQSAIASHTEGGGSDVATSVLPVRKNVRKTTTADKNADRKDKLPALLPESCPLADLLNPPGDAHRVQELAEPLTPAQAERMLHDYPEALVRDILCQMANWKPLLTKGTSANLTARNWLNKRANEAPRPASAAAVSPAPASASGQVTRRRTVIEQTLAARQARRQQ